MDPIAKKKSRRSRCVPLPPTFILSTLPSKRRKKEDDEQWDNTDGVYGGMEVHLS